MKTFMHTIDRIFGAIIQMMPQVKKLESFDKIPALVPVRTTREMRAYRVRQHFASKDSIR